MSEPVTRGQGWVIIVLLAILAAAMAYDVGLRPYVVEPYLAEKEREHEDDIEAARQRVLRRMQEEGLLPDQP